MICQDCKSALPDLLLDPAAAANRAAREHMESCAQCREEFRELEATFALLDAWQAPEPSPYFDQKLAVQLREAAAEPPAGWFERVKTRLMFNTGRQFRPAMAGALALVLLVGGGTFADLSLGHHQATPQVSATVNDLRIIDTNDQALQTMDMLLQDDGSTNNTTTAMPPRS
ncbi:hypothetical protein [Edaphobacter sp.]|uniref:hypothetical protein n=1 Tax=Edaphobacter sp. TaxID=1934404 RepID=UPI002DBFAC7A|nr:hypothetical protein [Edaphobacter sp.]HEU5342358.1 hypothetical protein [Edaphobacter sp.]